MADASGPEPAAEIDLAQLEQALAAGAPLIDVREPYEYEVVRVPQARLLPLSELSERAGELPRGERIYVICAMGGRSMAAATAMVRAGYDAVSVAGGTQAWAESGRPVDAGPASPAV